MLFRSGRMTVEILLCHFGGWGFPCGLEVKNLPAMQVLKKGGLELPRGDRQAVLYLLVLAVFRKEQGSFL